MKPHDVLMPGVMMAWETGKPVFVMFLIGMAFLIALKIFLKAYQAQIIGYIGERRVRKILDQAKAPALHDAYIPHRGGVAQVDHIVLLGDTIAVVETKCFRGAIYGDETSNQWTVAYTPFRKEKMYNPLKQNATHINAVRAIAGPEANVTGYVVMAGRAKFPKGMPIGLHSLQAFQTIARKAGKKRPDARTIAAWENVKDHVSGGSRASLKRGHKETLATSAARRSGKATGVASKRPSRKEPKF